MGKFRQHTIEEKRRIRNSRQKRKRKLRAAVKQALKDKEMGRDFEQQNKRLAELRRSAGEFCRKWKLKCLENSKLNNSLDRIKRKVLYMKCINEFI